MNPTIQTPETELLTVEDMRAIVIDWLGGCSSAPANTDVIEVLLEVGKAGRGWTFTKPKIAVLAHLLADPRWTRHAIATVVLELMRDRRARAAIVRHGILRHGRGLLEARRDVRALYAEAREVVQRAVLASAAHSPRPRRVSA